MWSNPGSQGKQEVGRSEVSLVKDRPVRDLVRQGQETLLASHDGPGRTVVTAKHNPHVVGARPRGTLTRQSPGERPRRLPGRSQPATVAGLWTTVLVQGELLLERCERPNRTDC